VLQCAWSIGSGEKNIQITLSSEKENLLWEKGESVPSLTATEEK